ncbi:mammaglobin-A-like [Choloepus didactylus]|uniref:mammaglobin-A-like n=1 Tax=Choloepus didactylus TaxID=27675 RepID=UPI0018A08D66|nr:mammaglobin-A-like [Choloepus didactylus]
MKLVMVLLLVAFPIYGYAGAGCQLLQDVIDKCIDPEVSTDELKEFVTEFIPDNETASAVDEFKQCFLSQSNETLANVNVMMNIIYDSWRCKPF